MMASKRKKLLSEINYLKGEVVTEPNTYSKTHVSGGGGGNNSNVSISSTTSVHSSCMVKLPTGKEYQLRWASEIPARIGHTLDIAAFRGETIAFQNEATDGVYWHDEKIKSSLKWPDYRGIPFWPFFIAIILFFIWASNAAGDLGGGIIAAIMASAVLFLPFWIFAAIRRGSFVKAMRKQAIQTLESR